MVAASDRGVAVLDGMPDEVAVPHEHLRATTRAIAAFIEGDDWLDGAIDRDRPLGSSAHRPCSPSTCPRSATRRLDASYLAWLDFRALGWGDDPAARRPGACARVALNSGHEFGPSGAGFARLNFACSPEVLTEAITRLAAAR